MSGGIDQYHVQLYKIQLLPTRLTFSVSPALKAAQFDSTFCNTANDIVFPLLEVLPNEVDVDDADDDDAAFQACRYILGIVSSSKIPANCTFDDDEDVEGTGGM